MREFEGRRPNGLQRVYCASSGRGIRRFDCGCDDRRRTVCREVRVSTDGRTLYLTNFGSNSLQVMDVARLDSKRP